MIELTSTAIDLERVLASVSRADAGGQVLFVGTTREWTEADPMHHTDYLIYEAHEEMALKQMGLLALEAKQKWKLIAVSIVHRLGKVSVKEASIAIAVSSAHRQPAFDAANWLIDAIKTDVPIWKQENFVDSTSQWVHPTIHGYPSN